MDCKRGSSLGAVSNTGTVGKIGMPAIAPCLSSVLSGVPPAEQMHVDVIDKLTTTTAHVHPETISLRGNVPLRCQVFGNHKQLPHQGDVLFLQIVHGGNMQLRDNQDVYGGLRVNVFKSADGIVFVHNRSWCTLRNDVAENTRHGLPCPHQCLLPIPTCSPLAGEDRGGVQRHTVAPHPNLGATVSSLTLALRARPARSAARSCGRAGPARRP